MPAMDKLAQEAALVHNHTDRAVAELEDGNLPKSITYLKEAQAAAQSFTKRVDNYVASLI